MTTASAGGWWGIRGGDPFFLSNPWGSMQRLIARLVLLVLLAGTFAPLAGALSMPVVQDHCARKPLTGAMESMPGCHHPRSATTENSSRDQIREVSVRSNQCCNGHACCRSLARSQCAQVCLHGTSVAVAHTDGRIFPLRELASRLDFASYSSGRAPPAL